MTADHQYSMAELNAIFGTTPGRIQLQMSLASTHSERLKLVEGAIDYLAQEFTKTRQVRQDMSEDALSIEIVIGLKCMGIQASHDTQYGGHCDIVVEAKDDFLWIAEAKIHRAYDWLLQGFEQLDKRYATGLPGQDAGEMIIYCKGQRADQVTEEWHRRLAEARPDVTFEALGDDPLVRRSTHTHTGTGAPFKVRHKTIPLYFKPEV